MDRERGVVADSRDTTLRFGFSSECTLKLTLTINFCLFHRYRHVYCKGCLEAAVRTQRRCPTCRKSLQIKQIHRVFVQF